MDLETATPEAAPVESPSDGSDALANFLAEDDTPQAQPDESGDALEAPGTEGEANKADNGVTEESPPVEEPRYKVKVRGEEVEVPLNELLNGYSRTEDYKAKTAEVAEMRRQAATEYADKLEQQVQMFVQMDPILAAANSLDWAELANQDPNTYVQFKAQYDQRVQALQQAQAQIQQARMESEAKRSEEMQSYYNQQREALLKAKPELADPAKLQSFADEVVGYLKNEGFTQEEITETNDHRALLIAEKARLWDAFQKAKTSAEQKKTQPRQQPTLKPRSNDQAPRAPKRPAPNASDSEKQAWILAQLDAE